jgi:CheY-like chemotaxis protein
MSTVVIIDDSNTSIQMMSGLFRLNDWEVESFNDSDQALERLNNGSMVDLIISDIIMNDHIDGITLARRLEGQYPVVLMTASEELQKEASSYGMPCMLKGNNDDMNKIWNYYHIAKKKFKAERNAMELQNSVNELQKSQNDIRSDLKIITENFAQFSSTMKDMGEMIQSMKYHADHFVAKEEFEKIIEKVEKPIINTPEHFNIFLNSFVFNARKNIIVIALLGIIGTVSTFGGYYIKEKYKDIKKVNVTTENFLSCYQKLVPKELRR